MTTNHEHRNKGPVRTARKEHPIYPAVITVIITATVLAWLTWKYYGVNGALFIGVLVAFALFRVLRPKRSNQEKNKG